MEDFWRRRGASTVHQERCLQLLQHAASFHCLVEEWKDCEELKPKPKEKWAFVNKKREAKKLQDGVVCDSKQVSRVGPRWLTEDSKLKLGR